MILVTQELKISQQLYQPRQSQSNKQTIQSPQNETAASNLQNIYTLKNSENFESKSPREQNEDQKKKIGVESIRIGNFLDRKNSEEMECEVVDQINDLCSPKQQPENLSPQKRSINFLLRSNSMGELNAMTKKSQMLQIQQAQLQQQQLNGETMLPRILLNNNSFLYEKPMKSLTNMNPNFSIKKMQSMQNVEVRGGHSKKLIVEVRRQFDHKEIQEKRNFLLCNRRSNYNNEEEGEDTNKKICKICLESEEKPSIGQDPNQTMDNQLIAPCQCSGSCKFVHQQCLKEWIISKQLLHMDKNETEEIEDLSQVYCEICGTKYKMNIVYGNIFNCAQGFKEHLTALKIAVFSFLFCALIGFLLFYYFLTPQEGKKPKIKEGFTYAIIICCSIIFLLFLMIFVLSIKEAFYYEKIVKWDIFEYNQVINNNPQNRNFLQVIDIANQSVSYSNSQNQSELSEA